MATATSSPRTNDPSSFGDLLLAFSEVTGVGLGLGSDHGIRTCYIGMCVGTDLELTNDVMADIYYAALAKDGGCTCGASQMAEFLGSDERVALLDLLRSGMDSELAMLRWLFRHAGRGSNPGARARQTIRALVHGSRFEREASLAECEVAQRLADRLGLGAEAAQALSACTERWDGKGHPHGLEGEAIPLVARVINLGAAVEIAHRFSGAEAAVELVRHGSGRAFDPRLAEAFLLLAERDDFWDEFESDGEVETRVIALEPAQPRRHIDDRTLDRFCEALADLAEFKLPAAVGHGRRVADRSSRLAERMGLERDELTELHRAALIHELGLITLSSRDLAVRRPDDASYRAHPLRPRELLGRLPELRGACELAALHHERIDASGWPAGAEGARQPLAARILAVVCAFEEARMEPGVADREALHAVAAAPGLASDVVAALAEDLDEPRPVRTEWPAGLTEREVEVLRLGATGMSVREISQRLVISPHTARHHLESVYAKIGCSTRAAAALFAAEHQLLD